MIHHQTNLLRHGFKKLKMNQRDTDNVKKLSTKWICQDLRPFSTLKGIGFRTLAQGSVNIGMFILVFNCQKSKSFFILSGHKYGVVNINEVLRSRFTAARAIYDLADVNHTDNITFLNH